MLIFIKEFKQKSIRPYLSKGNQIKGFKPIFLQNYLNKKEKDFFTLFQNGHFLLNLKN
jgi:hypothetical protein